MEKFHYTICGLDYIWLLNGFEVEDGFISFKDADALEEFIATEIVMNRKKLRGQEMRFLRTQMDMTQAQLAKMIGQTRVNIAKQESTPNKELNGTVDRLLRLIYTDFREDPEKMKILFDHIEEGLEGGTSDELIFIYNEQQWETAA